MTNREFSSRLLRILAWRFVASAQAGDSKKCRLIFLSMVNACRAFEGCTIKLATGIIAEVIRDQITATAEKSSKPQLAALRELRVCLKAPPSPREEAAAQGLHFVSDADFYGYPEDGAQ
jgi:hypothetical protein